MKIKQLITFFLVISFISFIGATPSRDDSSPSSPQNKTKKSSEKQTKGITTGRLGNLADHPPTSISVEAPKGEDTEDKLIIYEGEDGNTTLALTPKQMCDICHTTLDTGVNLLRRGVALNQQPKDVREQLMRQYGIQFTSGAHYDEGNDKLIWSSEEMADEICEKAMGHYKPQYTIACHDIIANHYESLWKPFNHKDLFEALLNDTVVLEHKLNFCYQNQMCVTGIGLVEEQRPCAENTPPKRTPCQSCLELAGDSRAMFRRLMTTIPNPDNNQRLRERCTMSEANFNGFKHVWCDSLALRHFLPDELKKVCLDVISNDDTSAKFYRTIKDGNKLNRLLRNATTWEHTLCTKVTDLCTPDSIDNLYNLWDEAADFDYNITQARYVLDSQLQQHTASLKELEEEYFFSPKYMFAPNPEAMSEDEIFAYKEFSKRMKQIDDIATKDEKIDLDVGNDENDEEYVFDDDVAHHGMDFNPPKDSQGEEDDNNHNNHNNHKNNQKSDFETEEDTDLSPELEKRLLGRLAYVNEEGIRVPNELPAHRLREYKAKRHRMVHDVKHLKEVEELQAKLDVLKQQGVKYDGKRRVWALPDSMLVSKRMTAILTRILHLKEQREKGKVAEQLIQDAYQQQIKDMKAFSQNFNQTEINKIYEDVDLGLDDGLDLIDGQYQDPIIDNEADMVILKKKNNLKDEL
jgi:hypothetical protein